MQLWYVQGDKPIPMHRVKSWEVVGDKWHVTFKAGSFINQMNEHVRVYTYISEQSALDEANDFWEYSNK